MPELAVLLVTIFLALTYAYSNGLNDAANAIATVISTRVLTPLLAVIMAGVLNLMGALAGTQVAKTIGKGIVDPAEMTQLAVLAAILASVIWVLLATRIGYPVSVSHSLVAGVLGSGIAVGGLDAVRGATILKVLMALAFSPVVGFLASFVFMLAIYWMFKNRAPASVNAIFGKLQILSAAFMSFSHGRNDGQNAMGIIALAWAVYYSSNVEIELWMILISAITIGMGTALGGWRVIRTLGMRITRLRPVNGFAAETTAAAIIEVASGFGLPVSTTHTITSSIMGVGATRRLSAVRWGLSRSIMLAWLVTYPFCFVVGWTLSKAAAAFQ